MECDTTILAMENELLFARLANWMKQHLGDDDNITLFKQSLSNTTYNYAQTARQQHLLEFYFRFLASAVISSDLSAQTLHRVDTIRGYLAKCSYMAEIVASRDSNAYSPTNKFVVHFRTKLSALLRLFHLLSSTDYINKLVNEDKVMKLGAWPLHLWGESLLCYAETSLRYWKPQSVLCIRLAQDRLTKCLILSPDRHQSSFLLANAILLEAKSMGTSSKEHKLLLEKAHRVYAFTLQLLPSVPDYSHGLARVCAHLDRESECQYMLKTCIAARPANPLGMLDESDFDRFRAKKWFYDIAESAARLVVPMTQSQYGGAITETDDKQYNLLQNSLIESGFSMKKLLELINWLPVSTGQSQVHMTEESESSRKQKERLQQRLQLYQLKPKRDIPGDGNCQMHAISDQLYDTISKSGEIRRMVVDWLQKNRDWQLPNGAILHQFVHDRKWEDYCTLMGKDGCWGDHLTLLAIAELFGAVISILSSVEGENFITEIHPTVKKHPKVLLLSHYAEFHYGSLAHIIETPRL